MKDNPKLLVKYPTRSRPEKFFKSLDNYQSLATHDNYEILVTLDLDDPSATTEEFKRRILGYEKVRPMWGDSEGKVFAINRDMCFAGDFDILLVLSDDFVLDPGFDQEILRAFEDGFSGLVHFPDGIVNERLCTLPIMDKAYFDLFGFIYNPIYDSVYPDNEQHEVAVLLGRYKFINKVIARHLHPAYGMAENDDLYRRNENPVIYAKDGNTYRVRKENNFGIPIK